jgi:hypothetical protein
MNTMYVKVLPILYARYCAHVCAYACMDVHQHACMCGYIHVRRVHIYLCKHMLVFACMFYVCTQCFMHSFSFFYGPLSSFYLLLSMFRHVFFTSSDLAIYLKYFVFGLHTYIWSCFQIMSSFRILAQRIH